jgi:hypothetical protein
VPWADSSFSSSSQAVAKSRWRPFARQRVRFTRGVGNRGAWAASKTDETAVTRLLRIAWPTVGVIIERVVADGLDADRLDGLVVHVPEWAGITRISGRSTTTT